MDLLQAVFIHSQKLRSPVRSSDTQVFLLQSGSRAGGQGPLRRRIPEGGTVATQKLRNYIGNNEDSISSQHIDGLSDTATRAR